MADNAPLTIDGQRLTTRRFEASDVVAVHRIEEAVSPDPWSMSLFADELTGDRTDRHWLVAQLESEVVGFGGLLFAADEAHIMNLGVDPDHQRRGIAMRLVANLLRDAGDRGSIAATLEVRESNEAALGLYQLFGFEQAGKRPRYYPDGEDAVIMWVHRIYETAYREALTDLAGAL